MPKVLILCPTFNHADTLYASIASVRIQTFTEWELVVICDGSPQRTIEIVEAIRERDQRIHLVQHPKGERHGEIYRDPVIRASNAEFICHLNDDDLWAPDHLTNMVGLLDLAEWVNQAPLRLDPDGKLNWWPVNSGTAPAKAAVAALKSVSAGINYVGYHRSAYLRLAQGWAPTPREAGPTDQYMWRKFLAGPTIKIASSAQSSALKLASSTVKRVNLSPEQRMAELSPWMARISEPGLLESLRRSADIGARMARIFAIHDAEHSATLDEAFAVSGMRPVAENEVPVAGVNGAAMSLPLTAHQKMQAWQAWAMLKCYSSSTQSELKPMLVSQLSEDHVLWRDAISMLDWDKPEAALRAAADFRELSGGSPHAMVL